MDKCLKCNKIKNPKNEKFCSRSCSVSYANLLSPKRKLTKTCLLCSTLIKSQRQIYCPPCRKTKTHLESDKITLKDYLQSAGSRNKYDAGVRSHARIIAKRHGKLEECFICKYNIIVQCCHIIPVSNFPEDTKLNVVNHIDNLIGLCPNHHWELDHGLLTINLNLK